MPERRRVTIDSVPSVINHLQIIVQMDHVKNVCAKNIIFFIELHFTKICGDLRDWFTSNVYIALNRMLIAVLGMLYMKTYVMYLDWEFFFLEYVRQNLNFSYFRHNPVTIKEI